MRADTQFAVTEATLKGYNKWVTAHGKMPQQDVSSTRVRFCAPLTPAQEQKRGELESTLETWAFKLMQRQFEVRDNYQYQGTLFCGH